MIKAVLSECAVFPRRNFKTVSLMVTAPQPGNILSRLGNEEDLRPDL